MLGLILEEPQSNFSGSIDVQSRSGHTIVDIRRENVIVGFVGA